MARSSPQAVKSVAGLHWAGKDHRIPKAVFKNTLAPKGLSQASKAYEGPLQPNGAF